MPLQLALPVRRNPELINWHMPGGALLKHLKTLGRRLDDGKTDMKKRTCLDPCKQGIRTCQVYLGFSWECDVGRHFRAEPRTSEVQERHEC